jgi:hypothetical protein
LQVLTRNSPENVPTTPASPASPGSICQIWSVGGDGETPDETTIEGGQLWLLNTGSAITHWGDDSINRPGKSQNDPLFASVAAIMRACYTSATNAVP